MTPNLLSTWYTIRSTWQTTILEESKHDTIFYSKFFFRPAEFKFVETAKCADNEVCKLFALTGGIVTWSMLAIPYENKIKILGII